MDQKFCLGSIEDSLNFSEFSSIFDTKGFADPIQEGNFREGGGGEGVIRSFTRNFLIKIEAGFRLEAGFSPQDKFESTLYAAMRRLNPARINFRVKKITKKHPNKNNMK